MKLRLIFAFTIASFSCQQHKPDQNLKFSQEEWSKGDWRIRGKMVEGLIEDSVLIGKSKLEIIQLLGDQGDTTGNFSYPVDLGLKTGPFGLGEVWMFSLNIQFDTLTNKAIVVSCND